MNTKISYYFEVTLASLLVGAAFNSVIAFTSLFFPYIAIVTAGLTGFGIITLVRPLLKRKDNDSVQRNTDEN